MAEILRKRMVICTPFGEYENGPQQGEMTPERLRGIAERFRKYPRNVPMYLVVGEGYSPGHVFDLDTAGPADGWIERLEYHSNYPGYPKGALVADVKLQGEAAQWVREDLVRGASIGTIHGSNPDGSEQGEVLQHVVLTNDAFDKSLNIAAARAQGGEPVASYFTALIKEADMADPTKDEQIAALKTEKKALEDQVTALRPAGERVTALETLLATKTQECADLTAINANLKEDIDRLQKAPALAEAMATLKAQARQILASKIRRMVAKGVAACQFNIGMVGEPDKTWDHTSDEVVLAWFEKQSPFQGDIGKLQFALDTFERKPINKSFRSGAPNGDVPEITLTEEERVFLKTQGITPEAFLAGRKAKDFAEYKAIMQAHKEK